MYDNNGLTKAPDLVPSSFELLEGKLFDKLIKLINKPKFEQSDCSLFEDLTYYLLKLIGINLVYKYKRDGGQKKRADGFFKIGNLAVVYTCILDEKYNNPCQEDEKYDNLSQESDNLDQIEDYCSELLSKNIIRIDPAKVESVKYPIEITLKTCSKEVWIITPKGESHIIKGIDECEPITVKQVPISSLIDIYFSRFTEVHTNEDLVKKLKEIGNDKGSS